MPLERGDVCPEPGKDRRLVAGPGTDLQDPVSRLDPEILGHPGHHDRLADGLAGIDPEGPIRIRAVAEQLRHERLAGDRTHGREDALVGHPASPQLIRDHRSSGAIRVHDSLHRDQDGLGEASADGAVDGLASGDADGAADVDGAADSDGAADDEAAGDSLAPADAEGDAVTAGTVGTGVGAGVGLVVSRPWWPPSRP